MGMIDCLQWQDPDLRFADGGSRGTIDITMCRPRSLQVCVIHASLKLISTDVNDELSDAVIKHQIHDQAMNETLSRRHESMDSQFFSSV